MQEPALAPPLDWDKAKVILRRNWLFLVGIVLLALLIAYGFVRYTKPVYESYSVIKLNFDSDASVLELSSPISTQESEVSGEIELLKSSLFLAKVVDAMDWSVSYYRYGRLLYDERYRNTPFVVSFKVKNEAYYDERIDIDIRDEKSFELRYGEYSSVHEFGEEIITPDLNLLIVTTEYLDEASTGEFFFVLNSRESLIRKLEQNIEVVPESFTAKTIRISITDYNRHKAADMINLIDSLYQIQTKQAKNQALRQKIDFLEEQIASNEHILRQYEEYFEKFTVQNRSTDLGSDLTKIITRLEDLDSVQRRLLESQSDYQALRKQLSQQDPLEINVVLIERLPATMRAPLVQFQELVRERKLKRASYNANTFIIRQLNEEIDLLRKEILNQTNALLNDIDAKLGTIGAQQDLLKRSLNKLPSLRTEYSNNRRFYNQRESLLINLRQAKLELEITMAGTVADVVVLSPASLPSEPITPRKWLIMGVGMVMGTFLGLIFLVVQYLINNRITGIYELERLVDVPILGSVPHHKGLKRPDASLVIEAGSKSFLSEALRTIRTNMQFIGDREDQQVIAMTSTVSGEGKTFVGINLGAVLALTGQKVCLVDLDMRKPKVHLAFREGINKKGVSTYLSDQHALKEVIRTSRLDHLDYVPAGPIPPNPSELLLNGRFKKLISDLKKKYDVVILDTPPVGLVTDGILVMQAADLQFYIVRSDYSRRSYTRTINDLKRTNHFDKLSIILNDINSSHQYNYGYSYYEHNERGLSNVVRTFFKR